MLVARRTLRTLRTDACGIPSRPTWSLRDLLSSYPSPSLSPTTFLRLHELSALVPPAQGTPEHHSMKKELDGLVRLVEAVKLVDIDRPTNNGVPDGRICAEHAGIPLTREPLDGTCGTQLLRYADQTLQGMYVVESDRER